MRVIMTMKEYEELKRKAQWFDELRTEIGNCTNQHWAGNGEDAHCTLAVNMKRVKKLLFDYAATDCELDGYTENTISWDGLYKQEGNHDIQKSR